MAGKENFVGPLMPEKKTDSYFKKPQTLTDILNEQHEKENKTTSDKGPVIPKSQEKQSKAETAELKPLSEARDEKTSVFKDNSSALAVGDVESKSSDSNSISPAFDLKAQQNIKFDNKLKNEKDFKSNYDNSKLGKELNTRKEKAEVAKAEREKAESEKNLRITEDFKKRIKASSFDFRKSNDVFADGKGLRANSKEELINSGKLKGDVNADYDWNDLNDFLKSFQAAAKKAGTGSNLEAKNKSNKLAGDAAKELITAIKQFEMRNGFLPALFEDVIDELPKLRDDYYRAAANGASIRGIDSETLDKTSKSISLSLNELYSPVIESKYTIDRGIDKHKMKNLSVKTAEGYKDIKDIPLNELDDDAIKTMVLRDVFDFEKMENAGLGDLASYIKSRYNKTTSEMYEKNPDGSYVRDNSFDRAGMFLSKMGDSAKDSIENYAAGLVGAGASLVDMASDSPRAENFVKGLTKQKNDDYKWEAMPEGQKTAAELIGSSVQILPTVIANTFVPGSGLALMGTSVYGNSFAEAKNKGASDSQAAFNGVLNAAAEIMIEKFAGGIPGLGSGTTSKLTEKVARVFENKYVQKMVRAMAEAGGEGFEEMLSYFISPLIDKASNIPGARLDYKAREAAYSWLGGFIGSAIMGAGTVIVGMDNSPAPEANAKATKAINDALSRVLHDGINTEASQKAIRAAEKAIKTAWHYDKDRNELVIPKKYANMLTAFNKIQTNPDSSESRALSEQYKGVGNTAVNRNAIYEKLIADKKISRQEAAAMDTLADKLGVNINFTDVPEYIGSEKNADFYNGEYDSSGNTINININGKDPLFQTVLHESIHALKMDGESTFKTMSETFGSLAELSPDIFVPLYEDIINRYSTQFNGDAEHDTDLISSEFTARMMSAMLDNPDTVKRLARANMNAFQRIADTVMSFFDRSIERYTTMDYGQNSAYAEAAEKMLSYRDVFMQMFDEGVGGYYRGDDAYSPESNYSIITLSNGMKYVQANEQVITSDNPDDWEGQIINYVNDVVRGGQDVEFVLDDGDTLKITGRTAWKLGDREEYNDKFYFVKGNASGVIDEIVSTSYYRKSKPPFKEHRNNFAVNGFDYRRAFFEDLDGQYYRLDISVGINSDNKEVYNIGSIVPTSKPSSKIIKKDDIPRNRLKGPNVGNASLYSSLPQNQSFDNVNINKNVSESLDKLHNEDGANASDQNVEVDDNPSVSSDDMRNATQGVPYNEGESVDKADGYVAEDNLGYMNRQQRIFANGRQRYGLDADVIYTNEDVSLSQKDIDERLGRNFIIPDEVSLRTQTDIKDKENNSLHFSDNVIFNIKKGDIYEKGVGRIVNFELSGNEVYAVVSVDSGLSGEAEIRVSPGELTFVSHNNSETVSADYKSPHIMHDRAKYALDSFYLSNNSAEMLETFSFGDAQYYFTKTTERLGYLERKLGFTEAFYDEGVTKGRGITPRSSSFDFDTHARQNLLLQYYDTIRNYNMAKQICDIYRENGYSFVDYQTLITSAKDIDAIIPRSRDYVHKNAFSNGLYVFNDIYRNTQRVFGNYYDCVKPLLDNFDIAKGKYARGLTEKACLIEQMCREYGFKPGSEFDAAIQMLGEGEVHLREKNKLHRKLAKKMGWSFIDKKIDKGFSFRDCVSIFGMDKALQIQQCSLIFRGMYNEYIQRANDVISKIYPGNSDMLIRPRKDYFRHFSVISEGLFEIADSLAKNIQIDPSLSAISDRTKPNRSWESIWQERLGKDTDYSAVYGFIDYMQHAEYTININPFIKEFREFGNFLSEGKSELRLTDLNTYIKYIDRFSNHLAKKTAISDRFLIDTVGTDGRTFLNMLTTLNNRLASNAILLNASVSIKQILNLKNGLLYLQNPELLINATNGLLKAYTSDDALRKHYNELFKQSDYLQERFLDMSFAQRKSGARKVAEKFVSIGDEFGCRAVWLAAYEDAVRLGAPQPVRYADDIARRCSAGRGIGEKPLAFINQTMKFVLPFLLENNNSWNVYRDVFNNTTKNRYHDEHDYQDKNSFLYYKNKANKSDFSTRQRITSSNSFRMALFLIATAGIGELIEELTGRQAEFNPVNDVMNGFKGKKLINEDSEFDFKAFFDGLVDSGRNVASDFIDHRNFSWAYALVGSWFSDNPAEFNFETVGSTPTISTYYNLAQNKAKGDYFGLGLDVFTTFAMPFGGSQLKKSINGVTDYLQGGNYWHRPTQQAQNWIGHNVLPKLGDKLGFDGEKLASKIGWNESIKGGKAFDIEKTPENFAKGLLFGQSAFSEAPKFWDQYDKDKQAEVDSEKQQKKDMNDFAYSLKGSELDELYRLWNETDNDAALPFRNINKKVSFTSNSGKQYEAELTDEQISRFENQYINMAKAEYLNALNTDKYKNSDDEGKLAILQKINKDVWNSLYYSDVKDEVMADDFIERYISKYGEDELVQSYRTSGGDGVYAPVYDVFKNFNYWNDDGEQITVKLNDEQIEHYTDIAVEKMHDSMLPVVTDPTWATKSDEQKKDSLFIARESARDIVKEFVEKDDIYKATIAEFDAKYGPDNIIRQIYEHTHDAAVYPHIELKRKWDVMDNNYKYVSYYLSKAAGPDGSQSEYDHWNEKGDSNLSEMYERILHTNFLDTSDLDAAYEKILKQKDEFMSNMFMHVLKNDIRKKLGISYQAPIG